ncbi:MAG: hypothetical protein HYX93_01735 [Chloroflexi bacterium]|nr:hypothetical protein [Chloroflexota bacterium]
MSLKLRSAPLYRRSLKRTLLLGLLLVALSAAGACATDEIKKDADYILGLEQAGKLVGQVDLEDETLVYPEDTPELLASIRSAPTLADKKDVISDYLKIQNRTDCILKKIEGSAKDDVEISCEGKVLVETKDEYGLMGVHSLWKEIQPRESERAKREYLATYLHQWADIRRVDHVVESLGQMKRTRSIPLFGKLVNTIHRFPIMFEGDELVPTSDISSLLDQFRSLSTEDARRDLAERYLNK